MATPTHLSPALRRLLGDMNDVMGRHAIMPRRIKSALETHLESTGQFDRIHEYMFSPDGNKDVVREQQSGEQLLRRAARIAARSIDCSCMLSDEAARNNILHSPVLNMLVYDAGDGPAEDMLDFSSWSFLPLLSLHLFVSRHSPRLLSQAMSSFLLTSIYTEEIFQCQHRNEHGGVGINQPRVDTGCGPTFRRMCHLSRTFGVTGHWVQLFSCQQAIIAANVVEPFTELRHSAMATHPTFPLLLQSLHSAHISDFAVSNHEDYIFFDPESNRKTGAPIIRAKSKFTLRRIENDTAEYFCYWSPFEQMSNHSSGIHDRAVIRDRETSCSSRSRRRARRRGKRRDRRRGRRRDRKGNTRRRDQTSPCENGRLGGDGYQPQDVDSIRGVHGRSMHSVWNTLPEEQLKRILAFENTSWIDRTGGEFTGQTLLQRFTEDTERASQYMNRVVEEVSSFCGDQTLHNLELGYDKIPLTKTYLDDRTSEGRRSDQQRRPGPLSVRQLYLELREKRFPLCNLDGARDHNTAAVDSDSVRPAPRLNADRRVIFITDLNPWGAMALASTASKNEALKVHRMIYRHLTFESHICVRSVASNRFPFYEFAFDIPYFVWRTTPSESKPDDAKVRGRSDPLRKVIDLTFLPKDSPASACPSPTDYLCGAHTSVLISAIDSRRNIAYALVDAYFDNDAKRESASDYFNNLDSDNDSHSDADSEEEDTYAEDDLLNTDPLTRGDFDANIPIQDPWIYFWASFKARIEVAEAEWKIVVKNTQDRIKTYISSSQLDHRPFPSITSEQHCAWIRDARSLLGTLREPLEALIHEWKQFKPHGSFSKDSVAREMSSVDESFQELEKCVLKLKCLRRTCDDFSKGVALYMKEEANRGSKTQAGVTRFGTIIAIIMLLFHGPLSISSGILSMQADAIPHFLGPTKITFAALTTVLIGTVLVFVLLIHFGIQFWRWCEHAFITKPRQKANLLTL
ncbi:hypothetical protein BGZ61DRAFT_549460 [Ilyonectria robusta]|uniref:uncharacterized protein n=1 Tax=Ilyonectria robusta TaxID=1079257 RepID=UPI001E8D3797|nr:uncharacterized protein BGZ61DRAFT_549460 [Ilyonectria robusta]KAH8683842.1 hypothetical protein BGZ61DRAFT_549460 [Ilyonectria robusta]